MAIQSGYGGLGGEASRPVNSATTRYNSKEILAARQAGEIPRSEKELAEGPMYLPPREQMVPSLTKLSSEQTEQAPATTAGSTTATEAADHLRVAFVRYKKLGPAGVAMWLEPAIIALGGVVVADSDSETSGTISVPEAQEEAARAAIIEWCELDEEI